MNAALLIDVIVASLLITAVFSGWRRGALSAGFAAVGVIAGTVVGLTVAAWVVGFADTRGVRALLLLASVVVFVGVGNSVGAAGGASIREGMRHKSSQTLDSLVGALLQLLIVALVLWMLSVPLAANLGGRAGEAVRESRVLSAIDRAMPGWGRQLPDRFAALIDVTGLPPLVSPFQGGGADVDGASEADVDPSVIDAVRPSVVHVVGDSKSCSRRLSGTGFVAAPDYVVTNAHVVAGTETVQLDTVLGTSEATVVLYNPEVDLAVLHAPGLGLDPLEKARDVARTGDTAMVLGFPGSGPFTATPARVRDRLVISGPDIYASGRAERESYTLRAPVRQGNSGGPLTSTDGKLLGVIFGAAVDGSETGYALTIKQVEDTIGDLSELGRLSAPADTLRCVG